MITTLTRLLCSLLLAPLSVVTLHAQAQDERWYKVELLVFSRAQSAGEETETWESTPTLMYPSNYQFLIDPNRQTRDEVEDDPNQPIPDPNQAIPEPNQASELDDGTDAVPRPTQFALLDESELMFQSEARQMDRSGQYEVLFHESWLHPMTDKANAPDIVLDHSGDTQQWPELQGSIKFYLSRYLHVETNLWLNTNGVYLPPDWQMPSPPLGPVSQQINDLDLITSVDESGVATDLEDTGKSHLKPSEEQLLADMATVDLPPVYPWRHALLLQQKRRMRSTEVHYIDHPALGVVIQITPVKEAELVLRAEQEAAVKMYR